MQNHNDNLFDGKAISTTLREAIDQTCQEFDGTTAPNQVIKSALRIGDRPVANSILRNRMAATICKISVVAALVVLVLIGWFRISEPANVTWSEITDAVQAKSWVKLTGKTADGSAFESWLSPSEAKWIHRAGKDVTFCDFKNDSVLYYDANHNWVIQGSVDSARQLINSQMAISQMLLNAYPNIRKQIESDEVTVHVTKKVTKKITVHKTCTVQVRVKKKSTIYRQGKSLVEMSVQKKHDTRKDTSWRATLRVNPSSSLPHSIVVDGNETLFSFPKTGPGNIYELGVPRDVVIVKGDIPYQEKSDDNFGLVDIERIYKLYQLTDKLGQKIWPGYDTRKIPIVVNNNDQQEILFGHPTPPKPFRELKGHKIDGKILMIRDGVTMFGPRGGGGWALSFGGQHSAYVKVRQENQSTERYLSLLLHECFHVYQDRYRKRGEGKRSGLPTDDPNYSAMIGLESRILHAALQEKRDKELNELCRMFVAVRRERRKALANGVIRNEGEQEYNEGTATYVQARMFQLIAEANGIELKSKEKDTAYQGFANAASEYQRYVTSVLPATTRPITFFHSKYKNGMAQCLLLDRVRPQWKKEMRVQGITQFELLKRQFPIADSEIGDLVTSAKQKFKFNELFADQKKLVAERVAKIRQILEADGTRYRIYHSAIDGKRKWKPQGPVYRVPPALLGKEAEGIVVESSRGRSRILNVNVMIWVGGIRYFKKGGLLFESKNVPFLSRPDYFEWIDTEPDPSGKDVKIEFARIEKGIYYDLKMTTDGFMLKLDKARLERSKNLVNVRPIRTP